MALDYVLVFVLSLVAGGWSIPAGLLLGLPPLAVYLIALLGGILLAVVVLTAGERVRAWILERLAPAADRPTPDDRGARITARWGPAGLATVGATLLGPTLTLLTAVALGVDRGRFLGWYAAGTGVGFALLTPFWMLVTR